ncbi:hypothetical protein [Arthrobacter sp. AZCC_0090]|uniref:FMN-binding protein n=1 Tax=Arthrobacter sp. AZCC_0090 TaxID=2735881 RepID=UPI00161FA1E0|nr:hypothetical protein [Arthrobacter sp. AZCC_0090]MBB6403997.1 uncharacterized protein with FMN-binding domain [Arthrobacter sp. AZCC_0090]
MTTPLHKSILVGAAGLSLASSVAACAPSAQGSTPQNTSTQAGSSKLATTGSSSSGSYKDGTYNADGSYTSPNGQETVGVQLTLSGGTVSAVNITVHADNPNTKRFQGEFKDGIAAQIVGKKLDDINVSKVAGSSLTSGGFNQAVEIIKSEAK